MSRRDRTREARAKYRASIRRRARAEPAAVRQMRERQFRAACEMLGPTSPGETALRYRLIRAVAEKSVHCPVCRTSTGIEAFYGRSARCARCDLRLEVRESFSPRGNASTFILKAI